MGRRNGRRRDADIGWLERACPSPRGDERDRLNAELASRYRAEQDPAERDRIASRLVEANMPMFGRLAVATARRHGVEPGDLVGAGAAGFRAAVDRFDARRGVKLVTYCHPSVVTAVRTEAQRLSAQRSGVPSLSREPAAAEWFDDLAGDRAPASDPGLVEAIDSAIAGLAAWRGINGKGDGDLAARAVRSYYLGGVPMTYEDVGAELGITANRAEKAVRYGLGYLRDSGALARWGGAAPPPARSWSAAFLRNRDR